ncbi:PLP-dependent aminotransferase family protein [Neorhizobium sp. P12A]|uniref:MocR-like pyridoxine biosynthesis transcription factor PdxR n=1 Tax=Neorhizobium sp. P12A TaxID=2268027 RepID=UPI0011EC0080|nr:PLP-dependent aminotransferase family protein [Neorhizobium sp. P12A]KAA0699843.1 PLP-dependent aminotransferase family protein [Neorhizobium sp. P12A]
MTDLAIKLDRTAKSSLAEQLRLSIEAAILDGRLKPGMRLPSWQDLATQLGVARGTVRVAYERLLDAQLIVTSGPGGTRVTEYLPLRPPERKAEERPSLPIMFSDYSTPPRIFQMGVPAQDAFPFKTWSRTLSRAARQVAALPVSYPDPRGERALRQQIAGYLAVARSMTCGEEQIFITGGYNGALGLVIRALQLEGRPGWMEEPGYPIARAALRIAGITPVAVPVDADGLDVSRGLEIAPAAAFALVTPGQQAPLGMTMSLPRRRALLQWAEEAKAWIIEDDYLSELQLKGRAAPALASIDHGGRVIHIGTFSKTISPALRLGFIVVPPALTSRFAEAAAYLAPAPFPGIQHVVAEFLRDGHYIRHLRKMKRLYAQRRDLLKQWLEPGQSVEAMAGLALVLRLPDGTPDVEIAKRLLAFGLAPGPLSPWYAGEESSAGLLLGITNLVPERMEASWSVLQTVIREFS